MLFPVSTVTPGLYVKHARWKFVMLACATALPEGVSVVRLPPMVTS